MLLAFKVTGTYGQAVRGPALLLTTLHSPGVTVAPSSGWEQVVFVWGLSTDRYMGHLVTVCGPETPKEP